MWSSPQPRSAHDKNIKISKGAEHDRRTSAGSDKHTEHVSWSWRRTNTGRKCVSLYVIYKITSNVDHTVLYWSRTSPGWKFVAKNSHIQNTVEPAICSTQSRGCWLDYQALSSCRVTRKSCGNASSSLLRGLETRNQHPAASCRTFQSTPAGWHGQLDKNVFKNFHLW